MSFDYLMTKPVTLVLGADADEATMVDVVIVPDGEVETIKKGTFLCNLEGYNAIRAEFDAKDRQLVVDYEHQTLGGQYARPDGQAPAAGWIHDIRYEEGRGIIAKIEWTAKARQAIKSGEYRYASPVVEIRKDDRLAVSLHSVAITNNPAIKGFERLAAKGQTIMPKTKAKKTKGNVFDRAKAYAKLVCQETTPEEEVAEAEAVVEEVDAVGAAVAALKAAMGLGEDVSPADAIMAAADKIAGGEDDADEEAAETAEAVNSLRQTLSLKDDATPKDIVKAVDKMIVTKVDGARLAEVEKELKVLKDARTASAAEAFVQTCIDDGRINPNDEEKKAWALKRATADLEAFTELMEDAPPVWTPGKVVEDDGSATKTTREKLIATARKEWNDNPEQRMGASVESWINTVLVTENHLTALSDEETKTLVV